MFDGRFVDPHHVLGVTSSATLLEAADAYENKLLDADPDAHQQIHDAFEKVKSKLRFNVNETEIPF